MSTVAALQAEIEKRRKAILALEEEIAAISRTVSILTPPASSSPVDPAVRIAASATIAAAMNAAMSGPAAVATVNPFMTAIQLRLESALAPKWQHNAQLLLDDGGTHELKDLVAVAQAATPEINPERVRKSLHVWLTRRTEKGELVKLERGAYRIARRPVFETPTSKEPA